MALPLLSSLPRSSPVTFDARLPSQVPDLFYRAVVKRRDPAHPGAVVIRFPEDGSTFWLPADEVPPWLHPCRAAANCDAGNRPSACSMLVGSMSTHC